MHFRIALPKFQPALPIAHPHFPIKVFDAANLQVNFNLNVCHDPQLTSLRGLADYVIPAKRVIASSHRELKLNTDELDAQIL
jgi:hypothetical protein